MQKCFYCNKEIETPQSMTIENETFVCCSDKCSKKTLAFSQFVKRTKLFFGLGLFISLALLFGSTFSFILTNKQIGIILLCFGWVLLGLTICVFPFATPQTFQMLGIQKTELLVRIFGIIIIATTPILVIVM